MATTYKTPGVYIEEIPKFPPSVAQVETAIPVFIGYTEKAGLAGTPLPSETISGVVVTEAKRIISLLEYESYFGRTPMESFDVTIEETYKNGTTELKNRVITATVPTPSTQTMYYHMQIYFANGGGPCYIISVGDTTGTTIARANLAAGLQMAERYDEPTLLVFPQAVHVANAGDAGDLYDAALLQAGTLKDRFVVMDCYADDPQNVRDEIGTTNLKYGAAYHPFLRTSLNYLYDVTVAANFTIALNKDMNEDGTFEVTSTPDFDALSTELQSLVKLELDKQRVTLPPSAAVVGAYALTDSTRGVWKAPANVSLNMVSGLTKQVTDEAQGGLNVDVDAGKSINVIRAFTGKGILIWGARTLAGNDNEWRYIPVRRFFNMVEESSKKASEGFVFEPNDSGTWVRVQGMLENFLTTLWRQGALQGAKPEHAFYVAVGLNKTMTALDILEGRLIIEIGMAVVRPAEFIILRFSHKMAES
ncbi:phage tail sheath family protein [Mucilaginibacter sp. ZT4R22]|uniref:Phage tail sheath family protein n=1 Tax=Mucilaginibacter pankratovii TaxID=2772110 RepID=A0ABR7WLI4_9SPHI|nr:phage tail sheath C-terminal domain-containing protein [Mucilaginibacter pankratovii]MBD1363181.1 phage tail sheath family protein [Mucilaginibacter pankratovii]